MLVPRPIVYSLKTSVTVCTLQFRRQFADEVEEDQKEYQWCSEVDGRATFRKDNTKDIIANDKEEP